MSLPTPPGTSHRDKENRQPFFPATARVAWSELHEIHTVFPDSPRRVLVESSASKELPTRSILKKPTYALPPLEESEREPTPEPEDPLTNLYYLESPVSRILAADAALRDLIEAYTVLAARLRACVSGAVDADASWPLFQPLRKNREALVEAMVRDLGRALEDPKETVVAPAIDPFLEDEIMKEEQPVGLPSPKQSPKRKKKGMSEEQVKHARDLCTTSNSVLKLLSAVYTMPAVYGILTGIVHLFSARMRLILRYRRPTTLLDDIGPCYSAHARTSYTERQENVRLSHLAHSSATSSWGCSCSY